MIIDSLTHVTPNGHWFSTSHDASETRLLREMDEVGVEKAVVVALAGYIENDFVTQLCARHPDRLLPGASINPLAYTKQKQSVHKIKALVSEGNFVALKLHPRLNKYDPLDLRCLAVLEAIATGDSLLPIWLDTYLRYRGGVLQKPPVDTIHELVSRFPSLNFLLLHSCGTDIMRLAEAIRDCPNAFLDISYTMQRYRESSVEIDLKYLLKNFDQKMVFGSDFPEISLSDAIATFNSLGLDLPPEIRARVLGENLRHILRL
ncbi:MAG: amidohydrolase family protein [Promethearchaeota archaeon]